MLLNKISALRKIAILFVLLGYSTLGSMHAEEKENVPAAGFLCFTNLSDGPHARLWFTNYTGSDIAVGAVALEFRHGETWTSNKLKVAMRKPILKGQTLLLGWREEVKAREGFTFLVPLSPTNVPWRISFYCVERAVLDPAKDVVKHLTDTNAAMHESKRFSGNRHMIKTPEVPPQRE
ncbi:MAG: hypothetical protein JWM68_551 [Verrucomicrobiales bacterium]|nr:hypothetical protein [Verrucomicrobiales bacterium]